MADAPWVPVRFHHGPPPMSTSLIGKTIGNVRIRERIGGGGVGHVWLAEDTALGRTVAVKMLRPELLGRDDVARRFRSEAQILARLNHPNIATIHSLLEDDGSLYMVMEYVEGRNFATLLRQAGRLPIEPCFDLFHQALDGVAHAHEAGVVHRDLKPGNLMVDERALVKVLDFGIARTADSERVTQAGNRIGTPEYMAPEQIRGNEATGRSDVYALAIVLYELLTGRVPFRKQAEYDVMQAQVEQAPPPLRPSFPEIPEGLEAAILQALAKDPNERFPTVPAFQDALVAGGAPARTGTHAWSAFDPVDNDAPTLLSASAKTQLTLTNEIPSAAHKPTEIIVSGPEKATRGPVLTHVARVGLGALVVGFAWIGLNWLAVEDASAPSADVEVASGVETRTAPIPVDANPDDVSPLPFRTASDPEPGFAREASLDAPQPAEERSRAAAIPKRPKEAESDEADNAGWVIHR